MRCTDILTVGLLATAGGALTVTFNACSLGEPLVVKYQDGGSTTDGTAGTSSTSSTTSTTEAASTSSTTTAAGSGGTMGTGGAGGAGGSGGAAGAGGGPENPTAIKLTRGDLTTVVTPSTGGSPFEDVCPAEDEVLIGFDATKDSSATSTTPWLKSAQGICGKLALTGTGPYQVTVTRTNDTLPVHGGPSDQMQAAACPDNQVIVGFEGNSSSYIVRLVFECAPLTVSGNATSGYTVAIGAVTTTAAIGGTVGSAFGKMPCNAGQIAIGATGTSGGWFDGFGLVCGTASLVSMAP